MFETLTIEEYCKQLSDKQPTPGGGSGLAIVGAIACSLVEMSANVTLGKLDETDEKYGYLHEALTAITRAKRCLYKLSNDDAIAYGEIVAARKLPKNTPDETAKRTKALQKAFHKAALVPLDVMSLCRDVIFRASYRIADNVTPYVKSDCEIGISLLKTVIEKSMSNVTANTCYIHDAELKATLERQAQQICNAI